MRASFLVRGMIIPVVVAIAIIALSFASFPYVRAVQLALAFVLFVDLATLFKGRAQNVCVMLASLAFGVTLVEGIAEARLPRINESNGKALWERDANLGYHAHGQAVVPAKKVVDGRKSYDVSYSIDAERRRLTVSNPKGVKVTFFGDSYTFGEGLNDAEALPQIFANMSGTNVLNYGYPGYSPAQALRATELGLFDKALAGSKLFILQMGPYQVERVACLPWWTKGFPKYVLQDGKLKFDGNCAPAARSDSGAIQLLVEPKMRSITRNDIETYVRVVDSFIELAQTKYHVPVLILDMVFDSDKYATNGFTQAAVEAEFRSKGAMVIDDTLDISAKDRMIPDDGHPTGPANKLMARKALDYLAKTRPDLKIAPSADIAASRKD